MPIQIGSLSNVPAPGDPITSPWAQAVTPLGVHRFANLAALNSQWSNAPDGALAVTTDDYKIYSRRGSSWQLHYQTHRATYTFDSGGLTTVTHGLGRAPGIVIAQLHQSGAIVLMVTAMAATTFTLRALTSNTAANFTGALAVAWWAT